MENKGNNNYSQLKGCELIDPFFENLIHQKTSKTVDIIGKITKIICKKLIVFLYYITEIVIKL